jgi:hypothetical protein
MSFKLKIKTDNAAFTEDGNDGKNEVARILREIADKLEQGYEVGSPRDYNGNKVGEWSMT